MTDTPGGPKSGRTGGDGPHQFISVEAALHQQLTLCLTDHFDRLCSRRVAMRHIDDLHAVERNSVLQGNRLYLARGANQHRLDDTFLSRLDRAAQGRFIAWMHDERSCWRHTLRPRDNAVVFGP